VRLVARLATISAALRDDDGTVQVTTSTLTVTAERETDAADGSPR
jgi:hypothetical protein